MTIQVTITVGPGYIDELKQRLEKYKIGRNELAREMGIAPTQISRWMNRKNDDGTNMVPNMKNIEKIEMAIYAIRRRRRGGGK
jgi:transcriptional regulator with XRE-family HTH domain